VHIGRCEGLAAGAELRRLTMEEMVYQFAAAEGAQLTFVIQPNRSMPWRHLLAAYLGISAVLVIVGLGFLAVGLPLVLPFSGLEMALLGAAFYLSAWRGGVQEVVTISRDAVIVESGRTQPDTREKFQRQWVQVILDRSSGGWYPARLLIRSHGRQLEIGKFLNEQERRGLALELRKALWPEAFTGKTETGAETGRGLKNVA
jgi:uncharacterized membrane protein